MPTIREPVEEVAMDQVPASAVPLGRGGPQHKYLQELIKRWADANGWHAVIEKPILDGLGSVDVALEKGGHSVACEVSVASTAEYEAANVQKCLAAGFGYVVSIVLDRRTLTKIQAAVVAQLPAADAERVAVLTPDGVFEYLEQLDDSTPATEGKTVRGYKVRVKYRNVSSTEATVRTRTITQTIAGALKRLRPQ